jgi:Mor family transcriptional regulator
VKINELITQIRIEDLPPQHRQYAEIIGLDNLIKLCETMGGSGYYIPQTQELLSDWVCQRIREEYSGYNIKSLVKKYGVSERTVYRWVEGIKDIPIEGQIAMSI